MNTNPYAPPVADLDNFPKSQVAPALWNPGAAAMWSLLFGPIFGAFLQMKNWQALGEMEKAAQSKRWVIGGVCFYLVLAVAAMLIPESKAIDSGFRFAGVGFLLAWFGISSRVHVNFVKARFGGKYPRRAWALPLLCAVAIAVLAILGFFVVLTFVFNVQ
jgi:hypothetical protein